MENELVPQHYKTLSPEPLEIIENWNVNSFHLGNVIKYIGRYISNGNLVDLKKARVYLDRFITKQEQDEERVGKQDKSEAFKIPCWGGLDYLTIGDGSESRTESRIYFTRAGLTSEESRLTAVDGDRTDRVSIDGLGR